MRLLQTVQTTYEPNTYVIDGCLVGGGDSVALSLSSSVIRVYDTTSCAFMVELRDHAATITDIVSTPSHPQMLCSSQEDGGVMVSDFRVGKATHFITDSCGTGITCSSLSLSPSADYLLVAKSRDMDVYDTRALHAPVRRIEQLHVDDISRVRYVDENVLCSGGEDQMINFIDMRPTTEDDDLVIQATSCGEVITRMSSIHELERVVMVGSCENAYVYPYNTDLNEDKIMRPDYSTYLVDWCYVAGHLLLVSGVRDDDGNPGPLTISSYMSSENFSQTLPLVHKQLSRVALGFGSRLITGGEDGLLAFWGTDGCESVGGPASSSVSSSARGAEKSLPHVSASLQPGNQTMTGMSTAERSRQQRKPQHFNTRGSRKPY